MKKLSILVLAAAAALALTACGGDAKKENVETNPAPTSASVEPTETETTEQAATVSSETLPSVTVDLPEEYESEYIEGTITDIHGSTIAIEAQDGTSMMFDISAAELPEEPVLRGSLVEVEYAPDAETSGVFAAASISVLMDIEQIAANENRDPVIYGKLQSVDINDLFILDDAGIERQFDNQISRTISFNDIKVGDEIQVTYAGPLLDTEDDDGVGYSNPYVLKIVSMDAIGSEEAQANYITGEIDMIYEDGVITVDTELISIDVLVDSSMIEGLEEGDKVRVYYTGSISTLSVTADKIEAAD